MYQYRAISVARENVARLSRQGRFQRVETHRDSRETASGSRDVFQKGAVEGSLLLVRNPTAQSARLQLSVQRPSTPAERCPIAVSGAYSDWVGVPFNASVATLFEGDANRDGRRDYLVLLSNGAAILLERNARPNICGFFGPPSEL